MNEFIWLGVEKGAISRRMQLNWSNWLRRKTIEISTAQRLGANPPSIARKDVLALILSSIALLVSLSSFYFTNFRKTYDLQGCVVATAALTKPDKLGFTASVLFNNRGNRDAVVLDAAVAVRAKYMDDIPASPDIFAGFGSAKYEDVEEWPVTGASQKSVSATRLAAVMRWSLPSVTVKPGEAKVLDLEWALNSTEYERFLDKVKSPQEVELAVLVVCGSSGEDRKRTTLTAGTMAFQGAGVGFTNPQNGEAIYSLLKKRNWLPKLFTREEP